MWGYRISLVLLCYLFLPLKGNGQVWSAVGTGVNSNVYAFAVDSINNELYVGGWFLTAGGMPASHIAKWNGTIWTGVGGGMNNNLNSDIESLCFFNGELYAAGIFDSAGGVPAKNIAKWDGSNWSAVGQGLNRPVFTLEVFNGELYAGGGFDSSGTLMVRNIAKWDGNNWVEVGGGTDNWIFTLCSFNNELYAGGVFLGAGSKNAYRVAKWNGNNWDTVGTGFNNYVRKLYVYNSVLYAGGDFTPFAGNPSRLISKLIGNSWQSLPSPSGGNNPAIRGFVSYNSNLYVTGEFTTPSFIAKFNGANYTTLASGLSWVGYCLTVFNNELYVGGSFSSAGGNPNTAGLAKWNDVVGIFENVIPDLNIVSPNPFNEETIITIPQNIGSKFPYRIIIYNDVGKIIREINGISENHYKLERKNLSSGLYIYELKDKSCNHIARGKMIVN